MAGVKWTRAVLLQAAVLTSAVNILVPLFILKFSVVEYIAVWLGIRAAAQLAVAAIPNPMHAMLDAHGKGEAVELDVDRVSEARNYLALTGLLLGLIASIILPHIPAFGDFVIELALYVGAAYLAMALRPIFRISRHGAAFRSFAVIDLALTLATLPLIAISFQAFLIGSIAKELFRIYYMGRFFVGYRWKLPRFRYLLRGGNQYLRGLVQTLSQYVERLLYPALFGVGIAGTLGLGSSVGIIPVMLSSNMIMWAFREISDRSTEMIERLAKEWYLLLLGAPSIAWGMWAVANLLSMEGYSNRLACAAAGLTAIMGINMLATARSSEALLGRGAILLHLAVIVATYVALWTAFLITDNIGNGLLAAFILQCLYAGLVGLAMRNNGGRRVSLSSLLSAAAFTAFLTWPVGWPILPPIAALGLGLLFCLPYLFSHILNW